MRAILNRDPDPIADSRSDVPPGLEAVILRCLEKQPDERFESARDVAFALQAISNNEWKPPPRHKIRWARIGAIVAVTLAVAFALITVIRIVRAPPPLPREKHLAVMRFEAIGDDPDLQEAADGLTETVNLSLAHLEQEFPGKFWVVPSAMARKPDVATLDAMFRKFNVTLAIVGRLERPTTSQSDDRGGGSRICGYPTGNNHYRRRLEPRFAPKGTGSPHCRHDRPWAQR